MGRLIAILVTAAAVLAAAPAAAMATHSNGAGPKFDFVTGTGQIDFSTVFGQLDVQLHVNAQSDANGLNPRGSFVGKVSGPADVNFSGSVTCLNLVGHAASVGGRIDSSNSPFIAAGAGVLAFGTDSGEGANAPGDGVLGLFNLPVPYTCPPVFAFGVLLRQGNFVAHDAL